MIGERVGAGLARTREATRFARARVPEWLLAAGVLVTLGYAALSALGISRAAGSSARDPKGIARLASRLPGNTAYARLLARAAVLEGHYVAATRGVEAAIRRNPVSPALWLDLARARLGAGDARGAVAAAMSARRRDQTSAAVCYDAAVVLLETGALKEGLAALRCVADLDSSRTRTVYDLAWAVVGDGETIRAAVVPENAEGWRRYARYVRGRHREEMTPAWAGLAKHGASTEDRLEYVERLLGAGRGEEAAAVWDELYGTRGSSLVFNGSFEKDASGRGLDWVLGRCQGTRTRITARSDAPDGRRVLEITFGGENVDYHHVGQVVPVRPGERYTLQASVRGEDLTSASGPRLTVRGYVGCPMSMVEGREWTGTTPWAADNVSFETPDGCSIVVIEVRRARTPRFDSAISGRMWIDRVELRRSADVPAKSAVSDLDLLREKYNDYPLAYRSQEPWR